MRFVAMRDLKINASGVLDGLEEGDVVVTRRGKPAAAMIRLDEDLLDDYILAHHPRFLAEVESARREYLKRGGISRAEMRRGLKPRRG
ncbi:MAG: type II toxin-antitoxin system prevent-host-death family antitoxin [Planctomycetes bacterium]|nr:type II toxin-antitoxin system prevent-host-death family antitoxin [Planctomycetota bacterium]